MLIARIATHTATQRTKGHTTNDVTLCFKWLAPLQEADICAIYGLRYLINYVGLFVGCTYIRLILLLIKQTHTFNIWRRRRPPIYYPVSSEDIH